MSSKFASLFRLGWPCHWLLSPVALQGDTSSSGTNSNPTPPSLLTVLILDPSQGCLSNQADSHLHILLTCVLQENHGSLPNLGLFPYTCAFPDPAIQPWAFRGTSCITFPILEHLFVCLKALLEDFFLDWVIVPGFCLWK